MGPEEEFKIASRQGILNHQWNEIKLNPSGPIEAH
jgi:hypothetical protein